MRFSVLVNSKQKIFFMIVVREKRNENRDSNIEGIFDTFKLKQDDFMNMVSDGF